MLQFDATPLTTSSMKMKRLTECQLQLQQDKNRFSILSGTEEVMIRYVTTNPVEPPCCHSSNDLI